MGFVSFLQIYIDNYDENGRTSSMQDSDMKIMKILLGETQGEIMLQKRSVGKYTTSRAESVAN